MPSAAPPAPAAPDGRVAQQFLRDNFLDGDVVALFRLRHRRDESPLQTCLPMNEAVSEHTRSRLERENRDGYDIYFGVNPVRNVHRGSGSGRTYDDLACVKHLHVDLDRNSEKGLGQLLRDCRAEIIPPPTSIVESSPGRFHLMWTVDEEDFSPSEALAYNSALVERYGGDGGCKAPTGVLRLPGFVNRKPDYRSQAPFAARRLQFRGTPGIAELDHLAGPHTKYQSDFETFRALAGPAHFPDDPHSLRVQAIREHRTFVGGPVPAGEFVAAGIDPDHPRNRQEKGLVASLREKALLASLRPVGGTLAPEVEFAIRESAPAERRQHLPPLPPAVVAAGTRAAQAQLAAAADSLPDSPQSPAPSSSSSSAPDSPDSDSGPGPSSGSSSSRGPAAPGSSPPRSAASSGRPAAPPPSGGFIVADGSLVPAEALQHGVVADEGVRAAPHASSGGRSGPRAGDQSQSGRDFREAIRRLRRGDPADTVVSALRTARSPGVSDKPKPNPFYYATLTVEHAAVHAGKPGPTISSAQALRSGRAPSPRTAAASAPSRDQVVRANRAARAGSARPSPDAGTRAVPPRPDRGRGGSPRPSGSAPARGTPSRS